MLKSLLALFALASVTSARFPFANFDLNYPRREGGPGRGGGFFYGPPSKFPFTALFFLC